MALPRHQPLAASFEASEAPAPYGKPSLGRCLLIVTGVRSCHAELVAAAFTTMQPAAAAEASVAADVSENDFPSQWQAAKHAKLSGTCKHSGCLNSSKKHITTVLGGSLQQRCPPGARHGAWTFRCADAVQNTNWVCCPYVPAVPHHHERAAAAMPQPTAGSCTPATCSAACMAAAAALYCWRCSRRRSSASCGEERAQAG